MKAIRIFTLALFFLILSSFSFAQTLGGYSLSDYLVSAIGPPCFDPSFITGPPDDSLWVNHDDYDTMTGMFGTAWVDHTGDDLLLETGYNDVNYNVRLLLSSGAYSSVHAVTEADWMTIASTNWYYSTSSCDVDSTISAIRFILALDFITDFGLTPSDNVTGIEVVFLPTTGGPDIAGVYIIAPPCSVTSSQLSVFECDEYTSPSGNYTWDTSGTYTDTILNAEGCDSIIYVGLIITDSVDATISLTGGATITANLAGATYQWLKCPDMTIIPGATDQSYTATENGDYALIVSDGTCTDTSDCLTVGQASLIESDFGDGFIVFPNPTEGIVMLELGDHFDLVKIRLLDLRGKTIDYSEHNGSPVKLDYSLSSGIYMISVESESKRALVKLVVK